MSEIMRIVESVPCYGRLLIGCYEFAQLKELFISGGQSVVRCPGFSVRSRALIRIVFADELLFKRVSKRLFGKLISLFI